MISRLAIVLAVLTGGIAAAGPAQAATAPAPTSERAANGYIACVWEGYVTHLGLCISMPV